MRRILDQLAPLAVLAALALAVVGLTRLTVDPQLQDRNERLGAELARVEARNARLHGQVADLRDEIRRLRSDTEESLYRARTDIGMVRPGEVVYQFASR